jgi:AraC-like DNA-binding protein
MSTALARPSIDEANLESVRQRPAAALRPYVAWYIGYRQSGIEPGTHRGLPSPYLTLIVTLDDPLVMAGHPDPRQAPGAYETLVGGLHTAHALIAHPGRQSGIQLALEPLGARALLGLPAGELANLDLAATDIFGPLADELHARVRLAPTWPARFAVLDDVLLRRLDPSRAPAAEVSEAWRLLAVSGGNLAIGELADSVGWSARHLAERLRVETGLSPKAVGRVMRFDRARHALAQRVGSGKPAALADLAVSYGYCDQAHLAREFRDLAGCAPSVWLSEELRNVQAGATDDDSDWFV